MPVTRIGLVGPLPPPYGGMANQTRQLANLLAQEGVHVDLIQTNAAYRPVWAGKIKGLRAAARLLPYLYRLWRSAGQVQLFHIMANSGWSWHLFAAPAIRIARIRKIPVIVNYRGGEAEIFFQKSFSWVKPSLDITDAIIVPSGFLEAIFAQRGYTARIVPNIIDLSRFSARSVEQGQGSGDFPHIVVTRNLEAIYDNATAIRAFALVKKNCPNARLTVAGAGPEKPMLENLVNELGVRDCVQFAGRIDNDAIAALYQRVDMMINASLVDGKTALLVPQKDPVAMAAAMLRILHNPDLYAKLRDNGLASLERYTWESVKQQLFAVYQQTLEDQQHSQR
jgi:glycosyltransferase involved in cell wall biosynthesis